MLIAQITDFHVGKAGSAIEVGFATSEALGRAVAHLNGLDPQPDVIVATGDLVDAGSAEEYARLAAILERLRAPWYAIPGNHDDRDELRRAFGGRGYLPAEGFLQYVIEGAVRIVALDTLVPRAPGGRLCGERLRWLDETLAAARDTPTVVIQHHPPFATGIAAMDAMGLDGAADEAAVIARHPQVERVLCGHLHRPIATRFAGTIASTCPSTTQQVELDLRAAGRLALRPEPPACQLHRWTGAGLVSHTSYVDEFGPAFVVPLAH